jgi:hypothetical protein
MSYKKTKTILLVWGTIFVVLTSIVAYGYLKLESTKISVTTLEQEVIQEKESMLAFEALMKTASNIKADSEKANTFFIKRDEVVNFLDVIESLASTTKTNIIIQSVSDKSSDPNSALLSVNVNAKGSYSNLHYLIRMFEELPYQTEIQNVRLINQGSGVGDKQGSNTWSLDVSIVGVML